MRALKTKSFVSVVRGMDNAELYVVYNAIQKKEAADLIAEFFPHLSWTEDEKVLDIGCGPGDVSTQILIPQIPKNISSFVSGKFTWFEFAFIAENRA